MSDAQTCNKDRDNGCFDKLKENMNFTQINAWIKLKLSEKQYYTIRKQVSLLYIILSMWADIFFNNIQ